MTSATRHDEFVGADYRRLGEFNIRTVREGLRWTLIDSGAGDLDFSTAMPFLKAARECGVEVIWDLLHFGWPDHLDIFGPEFVPAFTRLAKGFAQVLREQSTGPYFISPVNEISFVSWAGGDVEYLNPFQRGRGPELKVRLVECFIAGARAVREVIPEAKIVSPEPVIHIVGRPEVPDDARRAAEYTRSMFEAWDMILRDDRSLIDILGVNFYDRNQWVNCGKTLVRTDPEYRPFREILGDVWERYQRPVFVSETGTEGDDRPAWFSYILQEVRAAMAHGIPMQGICLYPILNHPGWDDDRHCPNGLWDYADDSGRRDLYEPLAAVLKETNL